MLNIDNILHIDTMPSACKHCGSVRECATLRVYGMTVTVILCERCDDVESV